MQIRMEHQDDIITGATTVTIQGMPRCLSYGGRPSAPLLQAIAMSLPRLAVPPRRERPLALVLSLAHPGGRHLVAHPLAGSGRQRATKETIEGIAQLPSIAQGMLLEEILLDWRNYRSI